MNGERQLDEFIARPCKATLLAFAKSIFTSKRRQVNNYHKYRLRSFWQKYGMVRYTVDRCDIAHRNKSPDGCDGCPFSFDVRVSTVWGKREERHCYFIEKFMVASKNYTIKQSVVEQHQWPKIIMKDMGTLLLGAVKLKNILELKKEDKAMKKLDPG